jgi:hypothetical protein
MNLDKALAIEGLFMSQSDLEFLAEAASTHYNIIELGSYLGKSTRALGDNTPGMVVAIDDWNGPRDMPLSEDERSSIYDRFFVNLRDLIEAKKVIPVVLNHENINSVIFAEKTPDMFFIDGDHRYNSVRRDVAWALSWIARNRGGLICGHDAQDPTVLGAAKSIISDVAVYKQTIWYAEIEIKIGAGKRA